MPTHCLWHRSALRRSLWAASLLTIGLLSAVSCGGDSTSSSTPAPPSNTPSAAPSASATTAATPTAGPSGTETKLTVDVAGTPREATVYVPTKLSAAKAPAIFALQNNAPTVEHARLFWGLREEADRLGFIAVFPSAILRSFDSAFTYNDGRPVWGDQTPPDDIAFFKALLDALPVKYPVDAKHVSITGWGNGAWMAARVACELSDRITGMAVSGGQRDESACTITRPIAVLDIHGTADPLVPYAGGIDTSRRLPVPGVQEVVDFWRKQDGCQAEAVVTAITPLVEQKLFGGCQAGAEVVLISVQGGGACWFGYECAPGTLVGNPDKTFKATPTVVQFLLAH